jgi:AbiJ N-terminal domain 4
MKKLFTDRHGMNEPRVKEELDIDLTKGLLSVINAKIDENFFGASFSEECPDGGNNSIGCDLDKLSSGLAAYRVIWPRGWPKDGEWPSDAQLFDLVEFLYEHAGLPKSYGYHSFFQHDHLTYDQEEGRARFQDAINRFFERNGLAFELQHCEVMRIAPIYFIACSR